VAKFITIGQLSSEITKALKSSETDIKAKANKALRIAAIKTWGKIIRMTPVDTGRARSNWFIGMSVGSEINTVNRRRGPQYINNELPSDLLNNKVYLYNNLPYIDRLEYGYSGQAPKGMVRVSLLGWDRALKKAFKGLE
jgi:hypothetical protein